MRKRGLPEVAFPPKPVPATTSWWLGKTPEAFTDQCKEQLVKMRTRAAEADPRARRGRPPLHHD